MKEIDVQELKGIQIDILDRMAQFCEAHHIRYWIDSGTLLGAVRHKGYIPWDDDIDTGMLREDYDVFLKLFNQENNRYKVYSIENTSGYSFPFAKIVDTKTVLYEPDERGYKLSVYVDLFVYDNAPDDDTKVNTMFKKRIFWQKLRSLQWCHKPNGNIIRRILIYIANACMRHVPKGYFEKKIVENAKQYQYNQTKRIGNFTASAVVVADKKIFDDFVLLEFEGKQYKAPIGYDEWLRAFYGDYMVLPPVEQRVSNHRFKAFFCE